MMNVTGVELKAGQTLTVKIEDGESTVENKIAQLEKLIANLQSELAEVKEQVANLIEDQEYEDDDPFWELDAFVDGDDSIWTTWFEPTELPSFNKPIKFEYDNTNYRNAYKAETYSKWYGPTKRYSAIDAYQDRVKSWQLTDPK